MMKILSVVIALLFVSVSHASSIEELDSGSCWIQHTVLEDGTSIHRVASFSFSTPFTLQLYSDSAPSGAIKNIITKALRSTNLVTSGTINYDFSVHCSTTRVEAYISAESKGIKFCLVGSLGSHDNNLQIEHILSDPENISSHGCVGVEPGIILFGLREGMSADEASLLIKKMFGNTVDKIVYEPEIDILKIKLNKSEFYKEQLVKEKLEKDSSLEAFRSYVSYNYLNSYKGESKLLWKESIVIP